MSDVLDDPHCDCRINRATGLQCRDCPKRRTPASQSAGPLADPAFRYWLHLRAMRRARQEGLDIPTFLRRADTRSQPPTPPPTGRCCED